MKKADMSVRSVKKRDAEALLPHCRPLLGLPHIKSFGNGYFPTPIKHSISIQKMPTQSKHGNARQTQQNDAKQYLQEPTHEFRRIFCRYHLVSSSATHGG